MIYEPFVDLHSYIKIHFCVIGRIILQQSILGETSFVSNLDGSKIQRHERAKYLTVGEFQNFLEQIEIHNGTIQRISYQKY